MNEQELDVIIAQTAAATKGSWRQSGSIIFSPGGNAVICQLSKPRPPGCVVKHNEIDLDDPDWNEAMANAALMVAAPDLLAEVKRLREQVTESERLRVLDKKRRNQDLISERQIRCGDARRWAAAWKRAAKRYKAIAHNLVEENNQLDERATNPN